MKYICTHKCFFRERSIKPGEVIDATPAEEKSQVFTASFKRSDGESEAKAVVINTELTIDELHNRLDGFGIAYKARDDKPTLMALYLAQVDANKPAGNTEPKA